MRGVDILILANTGSEAIPAFTAIASQRGAKLSEKVAALDVSVKPAAGTAPAKDFEYGYGEWSISCDGLYVPDDVAYQALVNAMRNRTKLRVRWNEAGLGVFEGLALVTSRDLDGPYENEATYSVELQGTGAPVATSAAKSALTNLAIAAITGAITPGFAAGTYDYVATVANATANVNVTATCAGAVIKINGAVAQSGVASAVNLGATGSVTVIQIDAAEPNKATATYIVRVMRPAA